MQFRVMNESYLFSFVRNGTNVRHSDIPLERDAMLVAYLPSIMLHIYYIVSFILSTITNQHISTLHLQILFTHLLQNF